MSALVCLVLERSQRRESHPYPPVAFPPFHLQFFKIIFILFLTQNKNKNVFAKLNPKNSQPLQKRFPLFSLAFALPCPPLICGLSDRLPGPLTSPSPSD